MRLDAASLKTAACRFEEFSRKAGFTRLGGDALGILLDDDRLAARSEEALWEAVVGWKGGTAGKVGWHGVVAKIRFPLMRDKDPVSADEGGPPCESSCGDGGRVE